VGDEVTAPWEERVWRRGVIHDLNGDSAFVVCLEEQAVRGTLVPVSRLLSSLVPLFVLNTGEDEAGGHWTTGATDEA
jgi:hypothetical protein